ncbi:hypothetical protein [Methanobrevibacter sp.]|uniref:hypothetical protein n=1 Tax=Methanobrevibacter sp. TaxID=66852 RepID=UPI00386D2E82
MNKKILACLLLIAAVASIGIVAAEASEINLPDGYQIDAAQTIENATTKLFGIDCDYNRAVMVNGDKNITVDTFFPHAEITLTPEGGSVMKNITGKEGLYQEKDGRFIFVYSDNDQFVQIDAPDAKVIEEIVGE